jgi:periplasmic copper chaperone A
MKHFITKLCIAGSALGFMGAAQAQMVVESAWSRATVPTTPVGAAYFTISNKTAQADKLISASYAGAERVELHNHIKQGDVMQMRQVPSVAIEAGQQVKFQPGGLHVMLMDLKEPLRADTKINLVLKFEKAGEVTVQAQVRKLGDRGADDHAGHEHHKH